MKRITRKFYVGVFPTSEREKNLAHSLVVCAENKQQAIEYAIPRMYGSRCFWFADSGLPEYGQVFMALPRTKNNSNPGNSAVTYRASLKVQPLAKKSRAFLRQERTDAVSYAEDAKYARETLREELDAHPEHWQ